MSGISKRVSGSWVSGDYGIMKTATDTLTTLPAVLYPNDTTATVGLKGNMQQTGTPTPDNPIMPSECGDRTGNLFIQKLTGVTINSLGGVVSDANYDTYIAEVSDGETYTVSNVTGTQVFGFFTTKPALGTITYNSSRTVFSTSSQTLTVPTGENIKYIGARYNTGVSNAMFNTGETALPYEPYGYKIPISSANTTTPIYLGEVETTRKIKKLVLDGTENWNEGTSNYYIFINVSGRGDGIPNSTALSTHTESGIVVNNNGTALFFKKSVFVHSSLADFKTFLQQQYANGTPVTVWYVLATETTAVVNEPLQKIGDYADEVSNISIPVTAGGDTISVGTTVQPSEITVNYKGWHPKTPKESNNGSWT